MEWIAIAWPTLLAILFARAFLLAFTPLLYRKRQTISLGLRETRIIRGDAPLQDRIQVFGGALFSGIFSLSVYLLTALVSCTLYGAQLYLQ